MAPRQIGALLLVLLTACASTTRFVPQTGTSLEYGAETLWYEVDVVEPGTVSTQPVPVDRGEFQRVLRQLSRGLRSDVPPREVARTLLEAAPQLEEDWLAEVHRGRVLTLVPMNEKGALDSEEAKALTGEYQGWCAKRGGGDCLDLLGDGPFLRSDDRRTLALALALGSVLDESREALARELLDPRAVVATLLWTAGMYLAMWLVPEPLTKGVAAVLTVLLVGWLGADALWGLVDGWATLAHRAHEARTFAGLREAGAQYAKVMGEQTARALVMGVSAVMGSKAAEVARRVRGLPGHARAVAQAEAQGVRLEALVEVEAVAASSEGRFAVMLRGRRGGSGAGGSTPKPQGPLVTRVLRHRGGHQQVILSNGQRWHLPRGKTPRDIPAADPVGDQLQAEAIRVAKEWGPNKLSGNEREAIRQAFAQGKPFQALWLERLARGRWVEKQLERKVQHLRLTWNRQGVDVTDPATGLQYEVLSGTTSNLELHGRRMSETFFRMIGF
jgi:hypothetical protein